MIDLIEEVAEAMAESAGWSWYRLGEAQDGYRNLARAVFSRLDALGYAVVPKEPTPEMVDAGMMETETDEMPDVDRRIALAVYRAMLAAKEGPK